jgi:hypothetical protein
MISKEGQQQSSDFPRRRARPPLDAQCEFSVVGSSQRARDHLLPPSLWKCYGFFIFFLIKEALDFVAWS